MLLNTKIGDFCEKNESLQRYNDQLFDNLMISSST